MIDYWCPCDQCNGVGPDDPYDDFDPMDEGVLVWDCSLPEVQAPVDWRKPELWPGIPVTS